LRIVVHNSHPTTGKGEKFRKIGTSLPPAHLLSTGAIIERFYIYEEYCKVIDLTLKADI